MTRPHGTDAADRPVDLIGQPLHRGRGSVSGVGITRKDTSTMPKADRNGRYRIGRSIFRIRKGDPVPEGAELLEERAEGAAPENKAKQAAPENRKASGKKADAKKDDD